MHGKMMWRDIAAGIGCSLVAATLLQAWPAFGGEPWQSATVVRLALTDEPSAAVAIESIESVKARYANGLAELEARVAELERQLAEALRIALLWRDEVERYSRANAVLQDMLDEAKAR